MDDGDVLSYCSGNFVGQAPYADIYAVNVIYGGPGDDTLIGMADDDQINGYDGHDYLRGNAGNDELNGGNGVPSPTSP